MKVCAIVINLMLVLNIFSAKELEKCDGDGFFCTNIKYSDKFQYTFQRIPVEGIYMLLL